MKKQTNKKKAILALAGNPNVGKSTVFNALTGMHQHTGNWPGKTVSNASGEWDTKEWQYTIYDLPGTYSLIPHSKEEECARDFICEGAADATIVVCDAVCLERNLNLVLQTMEVTSSVIVCINLLDEAKKKKIHIDLEALQKLLGVPVVGTSARSGKGLKKLADTVDGLVDGELESNPYQVSYGATIERAISMILPFLKEKSPQANRWLALNLLEEESVTHPALEERKTDPIFLETLKEAKLFLLKEDILPKELKDQVVSHLVQASEQIASQVVTFEKADYQKKDRKIDRFLTNKWTGIPIMLGLLMAIFWITMEGANYPSAWLFDILFQFEENISHFLLSLGAPSWFHDVLIFGIYRVLAWVIAVMLPPMAIFFPLFTILEDLGYLPRIAFNLDKYFKKCCACGKQALTMCMGFGCNAVGVTGCRIIDSPRERLIAMLTNAFVPCNGRLPAIMTIITMFFIGSSGGFSSSILSVLLLTGVILLGILMTFLVSWVLSKTLLKGIPSSFTLELPPYRKPQIGKVIIHSIFDRTLFVLGRAVSVAAPAGLVIWLMANIQVGDATILAHCSSFLDPLGRMIGLDGVILMAFLLGFPANEIVIPLMIMAYMANGHITDFSDLSVLKELLISHGWTWLTALCMMIFSLFHWPCSTTCLTIKKESGKKRWMFLGIAIPTMVGIILCFLITTVVRFFGLV